MKKYDRETKKYVEDLNSGKSAKKRKLCRGGKPHDFVLVLPPMITYTDAYKFKPEIYYESHERVRQFLISEDQHLLKNGITSRFQNWRGSALRHYACTVCGKTDYKEVKPTKE